MAGWGRGRAGWGVGVVRDGGGLWRVGASGRLGGWDGAGWGWVRARTVLVLGSIDGSTCVSGLRVEVHGAREPQRYIVCCTLRTTRRRAWSARAVRVLISCDMLPPRPSCLVGTRREPASRVSRCSLHIGDMRGCTALCLYAIGLCIFGYII